MMFEVRNNNENDIQNEDNDIDLEEDLKLNYTEPGHPIAFSGITNVYNYYKVEFL